jgi:class 3 adenylate cyclase/tetratricopeptide (TPR) repeat protein
VPARDSSPPESEGSLGTRQRRVRSAFHGERKQLTVLFADLGGSLSVIGGVDAEEAESLLTEVVAAMVEAVRRFDGTVNQVLGDGIMALFGAPIAHEDHAVRAACAALAMLASVERLGSDSWRARGLRPSIRVGLNSGEAILRSVQNDISLDYRAIGPTIHLAARMEQLAPVGTVRLTRDVLRCGRGMLRAQALGLTSVKGLPAPLETFELTGVNTRTRFQATIARGLSPFVGRSAALGALEQALAESAQGRRGAVLLVGDPGIGKSRLCHELLRSPEASARRVLEASALSYTQSSPQGVLVGLLKALCDVDDDEAQCVVQDKVQAQFALLGVSADGMPVALALLGLEPSDASWKRLEPVQRLRLGEQVLRELLTRWCERSPCILLIEDLHWADQDSLSFLSSLLQSPPDPHTLILATTRPEAELRLPPLPDVLRIGLSALSVSESRELVAALAGGAAPALTLLQQLAERTQGNPFFIEESTRTMLDLGAFGGGVASGEARRLSVGESVPEAVESLIATRLDRLPMAELALLQAAAVIGDDSPTEVLRAVLDLPEAPFRQAFQAVGDAELLYQTGPFRAPVFRFRHALLREVAYRGMLRPSRRALHGRVVEAFERLYAARLGEHVQRLAEHADQAEDWARAARYHKLASVRASERWANLQAIAHIDRGIDLASRLPPGPERDELDIDLRLIALAPMFPVGSHERLVGLLREAERIAEQLGDRPRQARVYSQLGTALWAHGGYDAAMLAAERAYALAQEQGDFALSTAARYCVGMIQHGRGQLPAARQALQQVIDALPGKLALRRLGWAGYPSVLARSFLISAAALEGRFAEAERAFAEGQELAEQIQHAYSTTMLLEEYAFCQLVRGEVESARGLLERAMSTCEEHEVLIMHAPIAARLAEAWTRTGEPERARTLLEDCLVRGTYRSAAHYGLVFVLVALSEAQRTLGDLPNALASARRAEELTRSTGDHAYHVCALLQLGEVQSLQNVSQASETFARAAREARLLGMSPFEAQAWQGRARCGAQLRERTAAATDAQRARDLWRSLEAPRRLREVEEQIRLG